MKSKNGCIVFDSNLKVFIYIFEDLVSAAELFAQKMEIAQTCYIFNQRFQHDIKILDKQLNAAETSAQRFKAIKKCILHLELTRMGASN
jgi:hypothetical protein